MNQQSPLVTIILSSVSQSEDMIGIIESVLSQSYPHLELIVVVPALANKDLTWIEKRCQHDRRLRYTALRSLEDFADALNQAFRQVKGTLIGWLQPTEYYAPHAIEQAVSAFDSHPDWLGRYAQFSNAMPISPPEGQSFCSANLFFKRTLCILLGPPESAVNVQDYWLRACRRFPDRMGLSNEITPSSPAATSNQALQTLWPLWRERRFSQAISLGNFCHAAFTLRKLHLRAFSGPFDWIFTNPAVTEHILSDNFNCFLDESFFEPVDLEQRVVVEANQCEHNYYREHFGLRFLFNHHTPSNADDYAHYLRAVANFRQALANTESLILFVTQQAEHLLQLSSIVKALKPFGDRFALLAVCFDHATTSSAACLYERLTVVAHDSHILALHLCCDSPSNGVIFENDDDNQRFEALIQHFAIEKHPYPRKASASLGEFDETWYLNRYPDVTEAIRSGLFRTGFEHYSQHGKGENREALWI